MGGEAKAIVDDTIDGMQRPDQDLLLLEHIIWHAFIAETGLQPEPLNGNDEQILYRGIGLRRSAAS